MSAAETLRDRALRAAAEVVDPEIPVLTIADLGVLRDVREVDGAVEVLITPTYSGCPAMNMIAVEVEMALERAGIPRARVRTVLSPAWTTDWMTEEGRQKLHDYGIAPPGRTGGRRARRRGRARCPPHRSGRPRRTSCRSPATGSRSNGP